MASDEAARRYAQAAFDIAVADGTIEQWRSELDDIASVLAESELARTFADDRIPLEERYALVDRVLDISPKATNLSKLLVQKGRSRGARFVERAFSRMADERENKVDVDIASAVELTPEHLASIEQSLAQSIGKTIRATVSVDPGLVGGIVIRVGDQLIDGSVRTRLRRLQRQLEGAF